MIRPLALALLLGLPAPDYAWVPFHQALREAEIVVTATLVELRQDEPRRKTAVFRCDETLKGDPKEGKVSLTLWEWDDRIACRPPELHPVVGKRYLLLLVTKPAISEIHPQFSNPGSGDDAAPGSMLELARVILDLQSGKNVEDRVRKLGAFIEMPQHSRLAYEAIDLLSRKQARPILGTARNHFKEYTAHWQSPMPESPYRKEAYFNELISHCRWTLSFATLARVREEQGRSPRFLSAASRVCGRPFASLEDFDAWWSLTRKRAGTAPPDVEVQSGRVIPDLKSADVRIRNQAVERMLDLGPSALPAVLPLKEDPDADVRATAAALEEDLRLLVDFADERTR